MKQRRGSVNRWLHLPAPPLSGRTEGVLSRGAHGGSSRRTVGIRQTRPSRTAGFKLGVFAMRSMLFGLALLAPTMALAEQIETQKIITALTGDWNGDGGIDLVMIVETKPGVSRSPASGTATTGRVTRPPTPSRN
jgi:hypothetical protein